MSLLLPIELKPNIADIPIGSGYAPFYDQALPTNVQAGESWSFKRIVAQFRAVLIEKEHEAAETTDESTTRYATKEEAENGSHEGVTSEQQITAASVSSPWEKKSTSRDLTSGGTNEITATLTTRTERSIFPCSAAALIELVDQQDTICAMTIDGTFRWFQEESGLYRGECVFSDYFDLTNPVTIYTEQISLRISLGVPLSVATEVELQDNPGPPGFVNLIYDKEVK